MAYNFTTDGKRTDAVIVHLTVNNDYYEFVVVDMEGAPGSRKFSKGDVLVTCLQADKQSTLYRLGGGYSTDFEGIIGPGGGAAEQVWEWFQQFKTFDQIKECFR